MKLSNIFNVERAKQVGAGVLGGLITLPAKKFTPSSVGSFAIKDSYKDIALLVGGVALGAFSSNRLVKTAGLGMAITSGFSLGRGLLENRGLGSAADGVPVFMGNTAMGEPEPVFLGNSEFNGDKFDFTSSEAGEMDY